MGEQEFYKKKEKEILLRQQYNKMNPERNGYRSIMFKAKGLKDNKWHYGYLIQVNNIKYIINNLSNINDNFIYNQYPVKEETICQYTGLNDVKENEIYEHDIIEHSFFYDLQLKKIRSEVLYKFNSFVLYIKEAKYHYDQLYKDDKIFANRQMKVVGNIYNKNQIK